MTTQGALQMKTIQSMQIRLPTDIHEYIKQEAARMGISQNAFLIVLLEQGRKLWQSNITFHQEAK